MFDWFPVLGPLALAAIGWIPDGASNAHPRAVARFAALAAALALALAIVAATHVGRAGVLATGTLGADGIGFGLYLDTLGAVMFALVAFVGLIVLVYSRNYLDGDPRQGRFVTGLSLTLAAVLLLIASGNLLQLALAWIATSLALNRLLLFRRERPYAVLAARKKFVTSRLGDACLITAIVLIYGLFGTLDYTGVFAGIAGLPTGHPPAAVHAIAALLVVAALLKSAQFPLHGWLTEVMETPTPVSALLHAGIINAGGFLVLRFAGLIALSAPALDTLVIVGGVTALFGSVVMLTQASVKVSLAYSTIAQMGFMMLECGLGAFSAALLHIVAHSLYKAHAFLSSGSVIDLARASWSPSPGGAPHPARMVIAVTAVLGVALGIGAAFGVTPAAQPGVLALGAIVLLGLTHLVAQSIDERPNVYVIGRTLIVAGAVAVAYFALQAGVAWALAASLPADTGAHGPVRIALAAAVVLAFAAVTIVQSRLPGPVNDPRWLALYTHAANGFYVNTFANRLALRLWPGEPPRYAATLDKAARS